MTDVQPMKMAAAEALYETESPASFSLFTWGTLDGSKETFSIKVPGLLSFLATGSFDGKVQGINPLSEEYQQTYGQDPSSPAYSPGDYTPVIPLTYWTFRLMIGLGLLGAAVAAWVLWATRRGRIPQRRLLFWSAMLLPFMPLFANSFAWIFTEAGRQPWVVFGLMTTINGVSPGVSTAQVLTSLIVLTLLYGALAVIEVRLMLIYIRRGAEKVEPPTTGDSDTDRPLAFAY